MIWGGKLAAKWFVFSDPHNHHWRVRVNIFIVRVFCESNVLLVGFELPNITKWTYPRGKKSQISYGIHIFLPHICDSGCVTRSAHHAERALACEKAVTHLPSSDLKQTWRKISHVYFVIAGGRVVFRAWTRKFPYCGVMLFPTDDELFVVFFLLAALLDSGVLRDPIELCAPLQRTVKITAAFIIRAFCTRDGWSWLEWKWHETKKFIPKETIVQVLLSNWWVLYLSMMYFIVDTYELRKLSTSPFLDWTDSRKIWRKLVWFSFERPANVVHIGQAIIRLKGRKNIFSSVFETHRHYVFCMSLIVIFSLHNLHNISHIQMFTTPIYLVFLYYLLSLLAVNVDGGSYFPVFLSCFFFIFSHWVGKLL